MTVSTTHIENAFTGDGDTTVFNFTFQVQLEEDVRALIDDEVQDTADYTVTLNSDQDAAPGGNVTFDTAPAADTDVVIDRACALNQNVAFSREAYLDTEQLEFVFDRLTFMLQEAAARTQGETGATGATGPTGPTGDVGGPGSSTDGALAIWDGTGGNLLADGPAPSSEGDILQVVGGVWAASAASASIPSGLIAMWDTTAGSIPTGWAAMDGSSVTINGSPYTTPDTRGKYVLAASEDDTGSSGYTGSTVRPGTISGTKTHQHSNGGSVSIGATTASGSVGSGSTVVSPAGVTTVAALPLSFTGVAHNHTATISGNTQASTEAARPIEVAFLLIIKVDE